MKKELAAFIQYNQDHGYEAGGYGHGNNGDGGHGQEDHGGGDNGHENDMVTIYVNDNSYQVHQGRLDVSKIRELDDIPITDVLYQMPDYLLLANDSFVVVHGGERFKSGGSSGYSS
ncbi:hypothetical protein [Effusibacillus consociatus]|uniref:Uncharacterized protein n=1 Tax=Effusibacillus consociatus TaxID=1117041 RepID=A0ABV9PWH0_9BACL